MTGAAARAADPRLHQTRPHPVHRDDGPHHADETVADRRYDD